MKHHISNFTPASVPTMTRVRVVVIPSLTGLGGNMGGALSCRGGT